MICPLQPMNWYAEGLPCQEEQCAWWIRHDRGCAFVTLASSVDVKLHNTFELLLTIAEAIKGKSNEVG